MCGSPSSSFAFFAAFVVIPCEDGEAPYVNFPPGARRVNSAFTNKIIIFWREWTKCERSV